MCGLVLFLCSPKRGSFKAVKPSLGTEKATLLYTLSLFAKSKALWRLS